MADDPVEMDAETCEELRIARKRPRRFVMEVHRGHIVELIVRRRITPSVLKAERKESKAEFGAQGDVFSGTVGPEDGTLWFDIDPDSASSVPKLKPHEMNDLRSIIGTMPFALRIRSEADVEAADDEDDADGGDQEADEA